MARDAVAITLLALNAGTATPAGTAINTTNGANIAVGGKTRKLIVRVTNTITNAAHTVTFRAGVYPPALQSPVGDLAISVPQSGDVLIALESARFVQADGSINVDYDAGMTGIVSAHRLPANL